MAHPWLAPTTQNYPILQLTRRSQGLDRSGDSFRSCFNEQHWRQPDFARWSSSMVHVHLMIVLITKTSISERSTTRIERQRLWDAVVASAWNLGILTLPSIVAR
ncbi:uncharacterized protein PV06_02658 [Exophiala oligosperma]|uniref:Uncharacterized protein n=1 Tax=Exophiala oligosperma TaxID=215243 RepID=A0A0D2B496_9EURO|nr:uncharacterized protein PV06_02658 [Exophiala oligosperma]KIW47046.1 hypothetical protein PV06_02658 [Exophiala oligosperma]